MPKTLDRNRPFGEICGGDGSSGKYEQDNLLFDASGNEIPTVVPHEPKKRMGRPPKAVVSDIDAQIEASLAG
jgi:hypothetical protein